MAAGGEQEKVSDSGFGGDLYAVLGLKKECSTTDLRSAYKKLALRWHPDRCSASGSSKSVEEAKTKFQAIQEAYSASIVLSDTSKRFLYDVGVYDDDDDADDANGMGEFLGEMAAMMSQAKPNSGGRETFEELQELFVEMFQADMDAFCGGGWGDTATANTTTAAAASSRSQRGADGCDRPSRSSTGCFYTTTTTTAASSYGSCRAAAAAGGGGGLKRDGDDMRSGKAKGVAAFDGSGTFRFGRQDQNGSSTAAAAARGRPGSGGGRRRKPKASSRHRGPSSQEDGETPAG